MSNGARPTYIASLEEVPIQLYVLPGIPGRIGEARAAGYAQGTQPLVSFVDPDDLHEASAFGHCNCGLQKCETRLVGGFLVGTKMGNQMAMPALQPVDL